MAVAALEAGWTHGEAAGTDALSHSHTAPGTTEDFLCAFLMWEDNGGITSTLDYGGQAMTASHYEASTGATDRGGYLFTLNAAGLAAASSGTFTVGMSSNADQGTTIYTRFFSGVDQTSPIATDGYNTTDLGGASATLQWPTGVAFAEGDMGIYTAIAGNSSRTHTIDSPLTEADENVDGAQSNSVGQGALTGSGTLQPTVTWSGTSQGAFWGGVLNAASVGANTRRYSLTTMGV